MINQLETRLMTDFIPGLSRTGAYKSVESVEETGKTEDYTSKDGGREQYQSPVKGAYDTDPQKKYYDQLKLKYKDQTELQLRKTEKIRLLLSEFGPEMFFLMRDYWNSSSIAY